MKPANTCLPHLPRLEILIVEAEYEDVIKFYDGYFDGWNARPVDDYFPYLIQPFIKREGIDLFRTPAIAYVHQRYFKANPEWTKGFPFGAVRVSKPVGTSGLTVIEGPEANIHCVFGSLEIHRDAGLRTMEFRSDIAFPDGDPQKAFYNSMSVFDPSLHSIWNPGRAIEAWLDYDNQAEGKPVRYKFRQSGEPLPWENLEYYENRLVRDRFNRNIVCEYIEKIGIPVEDYFVHRKVDRCAIYTDSGPQYQ
ncbi:MAG: hypothetical protein HUJ27_07175 [Rhodobacteraceae bacterium]|nr:hypothetical protein [Paracoccaceae bacterium]